ncbi:MAG: formate dehydrogenase subunit alpha [Armatimonadetes bacterium]|nr:formate dehydrogenase subunit alpha [Armatimonadota bacterium]
MSEINLTINNKKINAPSGTTILEAAKKEGINIPVLCYYPEITASGRCRICIVEIENYPDLMPACNTEIKEDMVIYTHSPRVIGARKFIMEMLLANHPKDCLTCESCGDCELQDIAYQLGIKKYDFPKVKKSIPVINKNTSIIRDQNKCILCSRCVEICFQSPVLGIWSIVNRGMNSMVTTEFDRPLEETNCVFCGRCIDVCPTGALIEKERLGSSRIWEMEKIKTICPYCGVGCNFDLNLNLKDKKIIYVSANSENKVNGRNMCVKGKFGYHFIQHLDRLREPLIKEDGKFKKVSWEKALNFTASKFKEIIQKYGPDSVGGLSSAKCTNEENYLFQKFIRACFKTNNVDHCARLCHAASAAGLAMSLGSGAPTSSIEEIDKVEVIFVIGSNTTETHPVIGASLKRRAKQGAKLIVADCRQIQLAEISDLFLQHLPGTDIALLNGIMHVILKENLWDKKFVKERTENFENFKEIIQKYNPKLTAKITQVPQEKIIQAAKIIGSSKQVMIFYAMGITQHTSGVKNVLSLSNLTLLTGNIGRYGAGLMPLRGQNNVQGSCDMGALPNNFPGYQKIDLDNIKKFEEFWKTQLPKTPGLTTTEMFKNIPQKIKALYIMGENPLISEPDSNHIEKVLPELEFLVVQDIFLTETAKFAKVVLPGASFAEKEGTFTNTERRVQLLGKALEPLGNSKVDWQILNELFIKFDYPSNYTAPEEIMREIQKAVPIYGGMAYHRLKPYGLQWPCYDENDPGTIFLHENAFPRGKGLFFEIEALNPDESPEEEYPFILTTGRILPQYHTGTMTRKTPLENLAHENLARISPKDAKKLNLNDSENIILKSKRGEISLKIKITPQIPQGIVFVPFHYFESAANRLTNPALDPLSKTPEYKVCAVKIIKGS